MSIRCRFSYLLQVPVLVLLSISSMAQWQQTKGPTGGPVYDVVSTPGFIFANGGPAGVFRSSDNGITWLHANNGFPEFPSCTELASHGSILYAAIANAGIYSSTDNGTTWIAINSGIEEKTFNLIFVDGQEIYAWSSALFYSPDNGASWTQRDAFYGSGSYVDHLAISGGKLFAAVNGGSPGIYVSENKGQSWAEVDLPVDHTNTMTAFDNAIYIVGGQPTQISRDYGATWSTSDIGLTSGSILRGIYAKDDKVYIGGSNSTIYYSENEGLDFSKTTTLPYLGIAYCVNLIDNTLWVAGESGLWASADNTATWSERNTRVTNNVMTTLVATDQFVYAGTAGQGVFVSPDDGTTWTRRNEGLVDPNPDFLGAVQVVGIFVDGDDPVVGTNRGIYKSANEGLSWDLKLEVADVPLWSIIGNQKRGFAATTQAQYYTSNGGEDWSTKNHAIFNGVYLREGMILGDTIIALSIYNFDKHVYISKDFGVNWESFQIHPSIFTTTKVIYVDSKLFVSTWNGVFVSEDFGETWTKKTNGLPTEEVTGLTNWNNDLYAGTSKGVYVTYDGGNQWQPVGEMFDLNASPLMFNNSFLFSGSYGRSVWALPLTKVNEPPVCNGFVAADLEVLPGEPFTLELTDFQVTDPDSNFPEDFTLTVLSGPNYTVAGNTVTPAPGFKSDLQINIIVNDGYNNSSAFVMTIGMVVGVEDELQTKYVIYPNPVTDKISVDVPNHGKSISFSIKDGLGRTILDNTSSANEINVSHLSPGVYYLVAYPQNKVYRFVKE